MRDSKGDPRCVMRDSDGSARDGECLDGPFLARGGQVRLGALEGRLALVEAGPILRGDFGFGFRIWDSCCVLRIAC